MPLEGEILDYPPSNIYVPKRMPQPCRATREEDEPIGIEEPIGLPVNLQGGDKTGLESDIWFKQDD